MKSLDFTLVCLLILVSFIVSNEILDRQTHKVIKTIEAFNQHPKAGKTYYEFKIVNGDTLAADTAYYDY